MDQNGKQAQTVDSISLFVLFHAAIIGSSHHTHTHIHKHRIRHIPITLGVHLGRFTQLISVAVQPTDQICRDRLTCNHILTWPKTLLMVLHSIVKWLATVNVKSVVHWSTIHCSCSNESRCFSYGMFELIFDRIHALSIRPICSSSWIYEKAD